MLVGACMQVTDDFIAREKGAAMVPDRDEAFAKNMAIINAKEKDAYVAKLSERVDTTSREAKQEEIRKSAFWLPAHAPGHRRSRIEKPPKRPLSPMSGRPLKLADLVGIKLTRNSSGGGGGGKEGQAGGAGKPVCAVSQKEINYNEAVVIATSGQVMLKEHFDRMGVAASGVCPVTGTPFKAETDIIHLRKAASGKAASGVVMAEHWTPGMK